MPPSRDYLGGADPNAVMSQTFDATLAGLAAAQGGNPSAWTPPRGTTTFTHPIVGPVGAIPTSNRATYAQIVVLGTPKATGENVYGLGQSGFIGVAPPGVPVLDAHFRDLLPLFTAFEYKPMPLYQNAQLKE